MENYLVKFYCGDKPHNIYGSEAINEPDRIINISGVSKEELEKILNIMNLSVLKDVYEKIRRGETGKRIMYEPIVNGFIYDQKNKLIGSYTTKMFDGKYESAYYSQEEMEALKDAMKAFK